MLTRPHPEGLFGRLSEQAPDPLLSLIALYKQDPRTEKLDLGVGVYRDHKGATPVMRSIKAAERLLEAQQQTKAYLGPEGDVGFVEAIKPVIFGQRVNDIVGLQTPGGTGALRLAAELISSAHPGATVWLGAPSWPIHAPLMVAAGLSVRTYRHYDAETRRFDFDDMIASLQQAERGDVVLLHGCCHNPSGADPDLTQWAEIAAVMNRRGVLPLIDLAYQGLGDGLEEDAAGLRIVLASVEEAIIAYSCDKNFGLYRERTGALFAKTDRRGHIVMSNLASLARVNWSMPPDHGAAAARVILETPELASDWRLELETMRQRISAIRAALSQAHPLLAPLTDQKGMFSILPLSPDQVAALRTDHAVYMAGSGRINIAGLNEADIPRFVRAFDAVLFH